MPVLLLNIDSFATKDTNGVLDGGRMYSVTYAQKDEFADESTGFRGLQVFKEMVPAEVAKDVKAVPGLYEFKYRRFPVKNSKPMEKIVGFTFLGEASSLLP